MMERAQLSSKVSSFLRSKGTDFITWLYKKIRVNLGRPVSIQAEFVNITTGLKSSFSQKHRVYQAYNQWEQNILTVAG
jgi:hypothetical protein